MTGETPPLTFEEQNLPEEEREIRAAREEQSGFLNLAQKIILLGAGATIFGKYALKKDLLSYAAHYLGAFYDKAYLATASAGRVSRKNPLTGIASTARAYINKEGNVAPGRELDIYRYISESMDLLVSPTSEANARARTRLLQEAFEKKYAEAIPHFYDESLERISIGQVLDDQERFAKHFGANQIRAIKGANEQGFLGRDLVLDRDIYVNKTTKAIVDARLKNPRNLARLALNTFNPLNIFSPVLDLLERPGIARVAPFSKFFSETQLGSGSYYYLFGDVFKRTAADIYTKVEVPHRLIPVRAGGRLHEAISVTAGQAELKDPVGPGLWPWLQRKLGFGPAYRTRDQVLYSTFVKPFKSAAAQQAKKAAPRLFEYVPSTTTQGGVTEFLAAEHGIVTEFATRAGAFPVRNPVQNLSDLKFFGGRKGRGFFERLSDVAEYWKLRLTGKSKYGTLAREGPDPKLYKSDVLYPTPQGARISVDSPLPREDPGLVSHGLTSNRIVREAENILKNMPEEEIRRVMSTPSIALKGADKDIYNIISRVHADSAGNLAINTRAKYGFFDPYTVVKGAANYLALRLNALMGYTFGIGIKPSPSPLVNWGRIAAVPVVGMLGFRTAQYLDYQSERLFGFSPVNALAGGYTKARVAQQDIREKAGLSSVFRRTEEVMPGFLESGFGFLLRHGVIGAAALGTTFKLGLPMGLLAGLAGYGAIGGTSVGQPRQELEEEYAGLRLVPVRKARFWGFGKTSFEGGRIEYFTASWYQKLLKKPEMRAVYGGMDEYFHKYANVFGIPFPSPESFFGMRQLLDPYRLEKCVEENTHIIIADGTTKKAIDINIGDFVVGHDGKPHKVLDKWCSQTDNMIGIKSSYHSGNIHITTPEHKYLAIKTSSCHRRVYNRPDAICFPKKYNKCNTCKDIQWQSYQPQWVRADELELGDFLAFPSIIELTRTDNKTLECVSNIPYWNGRAFTTGARKDIPGFVEKTPELYRLIGWYAAEGCISNGRSLNFCLAYDEVDECEWIKETIFKIFGLSCSITRYKDHGTSVVACHSASLSKTFKKWVPGTAKHGDKRISKEILDVDTALLLELVIGYFLGDGTGKSYNRVSVVGTAKELILQMYIILYTCGYKPTIDRHIPKVSNEQIRWLIHLYGDDATNFRDLCGWHSVHQIHDNKYTFELNGFRFYKIKDITDYPSGNVVDLKIEDSNSFCGIGAIFHNTHYYDRPYVASGGMLNELPIFGPLLDETVGQFIKPRKKMHPEIEGALKGVTTNLYSSHLPMNAAAQLGLPQYPTGSLPVYEAGSLRERINAISHKITEPLGFYKFIGERMLGVLPDDPFLGANAGAIGSTARSYYNAQIGGAGGLSELVRRFIIPEEGDPNKLQYRVNPIRNTMACLHPNTDVLLANGLCKRADNILEGEVLINKDGKECVVEKRGDRYVDNIIKIQIYGDNYKKLLFSEEHPLFTSDYKFVDAVNITVKDYVAFPIIKYEGVQEYIDLSEICSFSSTDMYIYYGIGEKIFTEREIAEEYNFVIEDIPICTKRTYPKLYDICRYYKKNRSIRWPKRITKKWDSQDFYYLLGVYAAEGSRNSHNSIKLAGHSNDKWEDKICSILDKYGVLYSKQYDPNGTGMNLCISCPILRDILTNICPGNAHEKYINNVFINPKLIRKIDVIVLIQGMVDGDGSYYKTCDNRIKLNFTTVSESLAYQFRNMCINCFSYAPSVIHGISGKDKNGATLYAFKVNFSGEAANKVAEVFGYVTYDYKAKQNNQKQFYDHNFVFIRVKSVAIIDGHQRVIGYRVSNGNTFCVSLIATHNSWIPGSSSRFIRDRFPWVDFSQGDPFSKIYEGESRLPNKGWEALHGLHSGVSGVYDPIDRFMVLSGVAPYSEAYHKYRGIAEGMLARGQVKPEFQTRLEQALGFADIRKNRFEYYNRQFTKEPSTRSNILDFKQDITSANLLAKYTGFERMLGTGWEVLGHDVLANIPYVGAKLAPFYSPVEHYEKFQLYGSETALWHNAWSDILRPSIYETMAAPAPIGALKGATLGYMLGPGPMSMFNPVAGLRNPAMIGAGAILGSIAGWGRSIATGGAVSGGFTPPHVRRQREAEEYFDKIRYMKARVLEERSKETGNQELARVYAREAASTFAGLTARSSLTDMRRALGRRERAYFDEFINAPAYQRSRILSDVSPGAASIFAKIWGMEGPLSNKTKEDADRDVMDYFRSHVAPSRGSPIWHPDVPMQAIKTAFLDSGINGIADSFSKFDVYPRSIQETKIRFPELYREVPSGIDHSLLYRVSAAIGDFTSPLDNRIRSAVNLFNTTSFYNVNLTDTSRSTPYVYMQEMMR